MSERICVAALILAILLQNGVAGIAVAHAAIGSTTGESNVPAHVHIGGGHSHHHGHGHHHHHDHDHSLPGDDAQDSGHESNSDPSDDMVVVHEFDSALTEISNSELFFDALSLDQVDPCLESISSRQSSRNRLLLRGDLPPPATLYLQICALLI